MTGHARRRMPTRGMTIGRRTTAGRRRIIGIVTAAPVDRPAPTADPNSAVVPVTIVGKNGADGHGRAKGDQGVIRVVVVDRGRGIHHRRVVLRHIDDLGVGRLHLDDRVGHVDHLLFVDPLDDRVGDDHGLFGGGLQSASHLRLGAERLNGLHELALLGQERLPQLNGPRQIIAHLLRHSRDSGQGFHVGIPRLGIDLGEVVGILDQAGREHDLNGINGRWQQRGEEWIRVERDGRRQRLQVGRAAQGWGGRRGCCAGGRRSPDGRFGGRRGVGRGCRCGVGSRGGSGEDGWGCSRALGANGSRAQAESGDPTEGIPFHGVH